jgi:hypothetical protein
MMVPAIAFAWCFSCASPPPATLLQQTPEPSPREAVVAPSRPAPAAERQRVKVKLVTPAMIAVAQRFIKLPMGSERYASVGGKDYVFVLEHHYHPPGFVGGPVGDHKGVTMYELR